MDEEKVTPAESQPQAVEAPQTVVTEQPQAAPEEVTFAYEEAPTVEAEEAPVVEKSSNKGLAKTFSLIAMILILVAGFASILFTFFIGYSLYEYSEVGGLSLVPVKKTYGIGAVSQKLRNFINNVSNTVNNTVNGNGYANDPVYDPITGSYTQTATSTSTFDRLLDDALDIIPAMYASLIMGVAMLLAVIFGIILLVKTIKQFTNKEGNNEHKAEKWAITCAVTYIGFAVAVRGMVQRSWSVGKTAYKTTYSPATVAGLCIVGICLGAYVVLSVLAKGKEYLGDKKTLVTGCLNCCWLVLAMVGLILVSLAPVCYTANVPLLGKTEYGLGFIPSFADSIKTVIKGDSNLDTITVQKYVKIFSFSLVGTMVQIWLIFNISKAVGNAIKGTTNADKPVKLGTQIFRIILSVAFMMLAIGVTTNIASLTPGTTKVIAVPVVVMIMAVLSLALSIASKIIFKKQTPAEQ